MKIKENLEINNYKDYQKHKKEIFDILEETMDLMLKEITEKNPTFLISNYDKMAHIENISIGEKNKIYIIPIDNNKPVKVYFE